MDIRHKRCRKAGCSTNPPLGIAGSKTIEFCAHRVPEGMVDVMSKRCRKEGFSGQPLFGIATSKTAEF